MVYYRAYGGCTLRITIGLLIIALLSGNGAIAATITVPTDYARIQWAIDNATAGDTIEVNSGTYYETVYVNKQLTLRGIGIPVVNASKNILGTAITLAADGIILEGFTVTGAICYCSNQLEGIKVTSNNNTLIRNNVMKNENGIYLASSSNHNTLIGNNASNGGGIYLESSSSNTLIGNNASNNSDYGISLDYSNNNTLSRNIMTRNKQNFHLWGYSDPTFDHHIDTNNLVDGRPIYYIIKASDTIYDSSSNGGTFYCISCVNVTIKDLNLNNNSNGIFFWNTTNSRIENVNTSNNRNSGISLLDSNSNILSSNNASNNNPGIYLGFSNGNILSGNNASNNGYYGISLASSSSNFLSGNMANSNNDRGISLSSSSINKLSGNNASNNNIGIYLLSSSDNMLSGNNASSNKNYGILLSLSSNYNTLSGNNVSSNKNYGILLSSSSNNKIYHNNFINNKNQAFDSTNANFWDLVYPIGGNYWSDYYGADNYNGDYQEEPGSDGIGDTPYPIPGGSSVDRYPLMSWSASIPPDTPVELTADSVSVNDTSGYPDTFVSVPVNITNVRNGHIAGIILDISFDSSIINLSNRGVQRGDLTSKWDHQIIIQLTVEFLLSLRALELKSETVEAVQ